MKSILCIDDAAEEQRRRAAFRGLGEELVDWHPSAQ